MLTKPSNEALTKIRRRMKAELRALRGAPAAAVIDRLNPVIRGQAAYYRTGASKRTFNALDHYMWRPLYAWALRQHRRKTRRWVTNHYFGRYNKARNDTWVSGDPKGQRRKALPLAPSAERAIRAQHGRCPLCGEPLLYADQPPDSPGQWETWFRVIRTAITRQVITVQTADDRTGDQPRLMHTACYAATQTAQPGRHAESRACPPMRAASARCRDEWHAGL